MAIYKFNAMFIKISMALFIKLETQHHKTPRRKHRQYTLYSLTLLLVIFFLLSVLKQGKQKKE